MIACHMVYWTECPHCDGKILLHQPSLAEILQRLTAWNKDDWNINILCRACGHGYSQPGPPVGSAEVADGLDPYQLPLGPSVFLVAFECADKNCEFPVVCFAFRDKHATVEPVKSELPKWESAGVDCLCPDQHAPRRPLQLRDQPFFVPLY